MFRSTARSLSSLNTLNCDFRKFNRGCHICIFQHLSTFITCNTLISLNFFGPSRVRAHDGEGAMGPYGDETKNDTGGTINVINRYKNSNEIN